MCVSPDSPSVGGGERTVFSGQAGAQTRKAHGVPNPPQPGTRQPEEGTGGGNSLEEHSLAARCVAAGPVTTLDQPVVLAPTLDQCVVLAPSLDQCGCVLAPALDQIVVCWPLLVDQTYDLGFRL